jgi:hypothetical protein
LAGTSSAPGLLRHTELRVARQQDFLASARRNRRRRAAELAGRQWIVKRYSARRLAAAQAQFGCLVFMTSSWPSSSSGTKPQPPHVGHCCSSSVPFSTTPSPLQSGQVFMCASWGCYHTPAIIFAGVLPILNWPLHLECNSAVAELAIYSVVSPGTELRSVLYIAAATARWPARVGCGVLSQARHGRGFFPRYRRG